MDDGLLPEMLREAERGVDQQLRVLEELDDKAEQLLAVGLATLGGGIALFGLLVDSSPRGVAFARGVLALGSGLNLLALGAFLVPYLGLFRRADVQGGPSLRWLAGKANDEAWTREEHLVALVRSYADYFDHNAAVMREHRLWSRAGLFLLLAGVLGYATAGLYAVG